MISIVQGTVLEVGQSVVVMIGGVGVSVLVPSGLLVRTGPGESLTLHTSLVVREDALTLYGFSTQAERQVFDQLLTVSGVGPRIALAALDCYSPRELFDLIQLADERGLMAIPGIGRKSAQRLILELTDKLAVPSSGAPTVGSRTGKSAWQDQVTQGLIGLGWSTKEAQGAVDAVAADAAIDLSDGRSEQALVADMLARALRVMGARHE